MAILHYILDLSDEMRRHDHELARIASNPLVHRPGDSHDAFAILQAAFAQHVNEGVGGAGVALLNRLVDLPGSYLVPSHPLLAKAHPASIWGTVALARRQAISETQVMKWDSLKTDKKGGCSQTSPRDPVNISHDNEN
jgi:hypothetical protein